MLTKRERERKRKKGNVERRERERGERIDKLLDFALIGEILVDIILFIPRLILRILD